jgi:hypothetical protein
MHRIAYIQLGEAGAVLYLVEPLKVISSSSTVDLISSIVMRAGAADEIRQFITAGETGWCTVDIVATDFKAWFSGLDK